MNKRKKINNIYQYLVWKFCKDPENVNWPKEIVIGKSLIKDHGEQIFKDLDFSSLEMESLAQFRTEKFKKYLKKQEDLLELDFRKEHAKIKKDSIGKKVKIKKKPKTLIDFLRYGSEKEDKTDG